MLEFVADQTSILHKTMANCGGAEPFALQVLGDSMEPEFPDGCIIIIEPVDHCGNGDFVMAEYDEVRWFRRFVQDDDGSKFLVALNENYPDIPLREEHKILGVITQRNIRRKIKHYHPAINA